MGLLCLFFGLFISFWEVTGDKCNKKESKIVDSPFFYLEIVTYQQWIGHQPTPETLYINLIEKTCLMAENGLQFFI